VEKVAVVQTAEQHKQAVVVMAVMEMQPMAVQIRAAVGVAITPDLKVQHQGGLE
jgi:hypothetical protein